MSAIKLSTPSSGSISLSPANTASNLTITVPATTATMATVDGSGNMSVTGNLSFNSGYGSSAVAYGCRAWVNFNGTGTVAIRNSGNVSSITDLGTGSYTLNFLTAMPDANYNVVGSSTSSVGVSATFVCTTFRRDTDVRVANTTSATTFSTCTDTSTAADVIDVNVSVFR